MSKIPRDIVDAVRERTDLVGVISRHVRLERRGGSFVGLCPFHQEKSPSFHVVPHKQMYHCFGCRAGGDVFKFLNQIDGISFVEAVKELAQPLGIEIPERELSQEERRSLRLRATLYDILEAAAQFYESVLWTRPEGEAGRAYLERRGLTHETIRRARIGYAPGGWTPLLDHLRRQDFEQSLAMEAGLAKPGRQDSAYDAFRERVVFPIRDDRNRVIGFGGRILEGDGPKYLNSPETPLYQKSHVLYGLETARQSMQQKDRAIVVEGYFDVVSLHQAGFLEAVATCGTSLTPDHLEKMRRMTRNVIVLTDSDEAGSRAAERILPMMLSVGLQAWRLHLGDAKDPDELVQRAGPEAMERAIEHKEPLLEWFIERKLESRGNNTMARQRTVEELLPLLKQLPDSVISDVAARLHQREEVLREQVRTFRPEPGPMGAEPAPLPPPTPARDGWKPHRDAVHLLWLLVHRYEQVADIVARIDPDMLEAPLQPVVARLVTGEPIAALLPEVEDPEVHRTLQAIVARTELYEPDEAPLGLCELLERLWATRRESRLRTLTARVNDGLRDGDGGAHRAALAERAELVSLKNAVRSTLLSRDIHGFLGLLDRIRAVQAGYDS